MPVTPAPTPPEPWRVSWQVWPATAYAPEPRGRGGYCRQPPVHRKCFADQAAAQDFAALLVATEASRGATCVTSIQNLTPHPEAEIPSLPGSDDFPWRARKAPRT
jgi:hypothetical protein